MSALDLDVNQPQGALLSMDKRFRGYVGGFGSGKTFVGCIGLCNAGYRWPGIPQGYFAPTYPQIRDIFYPTIEEVAEKMGLTCRIKTGDHEVQLLSGSRLRSLVICRSLEHPERIVGFKIGRALVDELDVMPLLKAQMAWRKVIARMRWGKDVKDAAGRPFVPQIDVTTTPEGFRFMHQQFVKNVRDKPSLERLYGIVQASTFANEANLPEGYIDSLMESYPEQLISAYLHGQFVNLASGSVYSHYDRVKNRTDAKAEDSEPLHIGMDFNINKMSAIVHVVRNGRPRAVAELVKLRDTPAMIEKIKERFWEYKDGQWKQTRAITVYPDAAGNSGSSKDASKTDIALLKQAGFIVSAPNANPPVRDRILAMNMGFCDNKQDRKYLVNDDTCPTYAEALEQQAYNAAGDPDKTADQDHPNDAAGYFIHRRFPVIRPAFGLALGTAA